MSHLYDAIVIGAGTAGLSAIRAIRRHTDNFLLVNNGIYGTTCARVGCMPSKVLIEAANACSRARWVSSLGIYRAETPQIDTQALMRHVRSLRDYFIEGVHKRTDELGDSSISGDVSMAAVDRVRVDDDEFRTRAIVIATGSTPIVPPDWQLPGDRMFTSDALFELETLPSRMAVIGLGALGLEMAQALAQVGIEVHGFESSMCIGGISDPDINDAAFASLQDEVCLHRGTEADVSHSNDDIVVTAGDTSVTTDAVLVALGRRPNIDSLGLSALGIELDDKGLPPWNRETMQVANLPVFMAGDVNGHAPLLHEAADEGYVAGLNAVAEEVGCYRRRTPLGICFTSPAIARVGDDFVEDAEADKIVRGDADYTDQGRARTQGANRGKLRIYADASNGRLLGAQLCAPGGEHLAHLLAWSIQQQKTVFELLAMPFYHPTIEEGLRTAFRKVAKQVSTAGRTGEILSCDRMPYDHLD